MRLAVVIPVKSFTVAKGRLADVLSPAGREVLARQCADTVVRAAAPARAYVVCNDESIAEWARAAGATVVGQTTPGLNGAVRDGWDAAVSDGADHIVIAHADLPLAASFAHVPRGGSVSVVPDRHRDGTNVMSLPAAAQFDLHYGPGSSPRTPPRRSGADWSLSSSRTATSPSTSTLPTTSTNCSVAGTTPWRRPHDERERPRTDTDAARGLARRVDH